MSSAHRHPRVSLGDHEVDLALAHPDVRKRLARKLQLDRTWDIPYLGGYSENGRTIYLDRHLPKSFEYHGKRISLDPFLILHEEIEKALIDELRFKYAHAHEVATRFEEEAAADAHIEIPWYRRVLKPYIKADAKEKLLRVPRDIDMTPMRALPVDHALVRKIIHAQDHPQPFHRSNSNAA